MLKKYVYTLGQVRILFIKLAAASKQQTMISKKPLENFSFIWKKWSDQDTVLEYEVSETLETDMGERTGILRFKTPKFKLARLCVNDILRANNIKEEDFNKYTYADFGILSTTHAPRSDEDEFFSFELVLK